MKRTWYKNALERHGKTVLYSTLGSLFFSLSLLLWDFAFGRRFEWRDIESIPEPDVFVRVLYSALVFATLGAFLYWMRFYQFLYHVFVNILGDRGFYRELKRVIWGLLMLLMYFCIIPFVVHLLNVIISFFYNLLGLLLYLCPVIGITCIIVAILFLFIKYWKGGEIFK
jgi:hypothetical protein